jgi:hypothetical protein
MNEEELKKKIRRLSKENHTKYYDDDYGEDLEIDNDKEIERLKRILEGFQKGKLEERERIRQLLGFFQSNMKVINEDEAQIRIDDWEDLKEQLQKEIGEEKGK